MTTKAEIQTWLEEAKKDDVQATHVLVVCDQYDWEDYPVFVYAGQDVKTIIKEYTNDLSEVMAVYDLSKDIAPQLDEERAYNI